VANAAQLDERLTGRALQLAGSRIILQHLDAAAAQIGDADGLANSAGGAVWERGAAHAADNV
jgi:hypothetical protein